MNTSRTWGGIIIAVIVVAVLGVVYVNSTRKPNEASGDKTVNIGVVMGFTGAAVQDSEEMKRGIELAKEDLVKEGYTVNINYQDDNTDPAKTVTALQSMLVQTRPDFVVGPAWSFLASAASDTFSQNKLISYQPANTSEYVDAGDYRYFLFGAPKVADRGPEVEKFIAEHNVKTVLVVSEDGAWGVTNIKAFETAAANKGAKVIGVEKVAYGDTATMNSVMAKYKSANPDLILWTGDEEGINTLLKGYRQYGYNGLLLGDVLIRFRSAGELAKQTGKAYYFSNRVSPDFIAKYKAKFNADPGIYSDSAYDGTMMLAKAVAEKGHNSDALIDYVKSEDFKYSGYQAEYSFDERGDISLSTWEVKKVE